MRYATKKKLLYLAITIIVLILLLHPDMNTRRTYEFIEKQNILSSLHEEIAENFTSTAIADCDYHYIIYDDTTLPANMIDGDLNEGYRIKDGGEYAPSDCKSLYSAAIIVPFRLIWPYVKHFGGPIAILGKQFKDINGMSNKYFGVSGEDDDFYARLEANKFRLLRFDPLTSRYHKIAHTQNRLLNKRKSIFTKKEMAEDGLNSLRYTEVATVLHPLFTHIMVDL